MLTGQASLRIIVVTVAKSCSAMWRKTYLLARFVMLLEGVVGTKEGGARTSPKECREKENSVRMNVTEVAKQHEGMLGFVKQ